MVSINWQAYSKSLDRSEIDAERVFAPEMKALRQVIAGHVNRALAAAVEMGGDTMRDHLGYLRHGAQGLIRKITRSSLREPAYIDVSGLLLFFYKVAHSRLGYAHDPIGSRMLATLAEESTITEDPAYIKLQQALDKKTDWDDEYSTQVFDAAMFLAWKLPLNLVKLP